MKTEKPLIERKDQIDEFKLAIINAKKGQCVIYHEEDVKEAVERFKDKPLIERKDQIDEEQGTNNFIYHEEDVKEAVEKLKESIKQGVTRNKVLPLDWCFDRIDKIFGEFK